MPEREKRLLECLEKRKNGLFFVVVSILGLLIRQTGMNFVSHDMVTFLLPWYETMKKYGNLASLKSQIGNYNLFYQTLIALFGYLPGSGMIYYKAISILFDYALALSAACLAVRIKGENIGERTFLLVYTAVLCLPTVVWNSAYWGQCDSIYTTFLILTLLFLLEERYLPAFLMLGLGFAAKLQTIFLLPFIVCFYCYKKKFSMAWFLVSLLTFWGTGIAAFLQGRSLLAPFTIYAQQTEEYPYMYLNTSSFWVLLGNHYTELGTFAVFLTLLLCGVVLYLILSSVIKMDSKEDSLKVACGLMWICLLFLPAMHERYTYPLDILLLILAFVRKKYAKYAVVSVLLSITTYGNYLFGGSGVSSLHAIINTVAWLFYMRTLLFPAKMEEEGF